MPVEAHRLVLGEDEVLAHPAVEAIREGEVDDPIGAAEGDGRFGPIAGKRLQTRPLPPARITAKTSFIPRRVRDRPVCSGCYNIVDYSGTRWRSGRRARPRRGYTNRLPAPNGSWELSRLRLHIVCISPNLSSFATLFVVLSRPLLPPAFILISFILCP